MKTLPQREIIIEYFKKHPNRNIKHPEVIARIKTMRKKKN